jgi:hypothetical protein
MRFSSVSHVLRLATAGRGAVSNSFSCAGRWWVSHSKFLFIQSDLIMTFVSNLPTHNTTCSQIFDPRFFAVLWSQQPTSFAEVWYKSNQRPCPMCDAAAKCLLIERYFKFQVSFLTFYFFWIFLFWFVHSTLTYIMTHCQLKMQLFSISDHKRATKAVAH